MVDQTNDNMAADPRGQIAVESDVGYLPPVVEPRYDHLYLLPSNST